MECARRDGVTWPLCVGVTCRDAERARILLSLMPSRPMSRCSCEACRDAETISSLYKDLTHSSQTCVSCLNEVS